MCARVWERPPLTIARRNATLHSLCDEPTAASAFRHFVSELPSLRSGDPQARASISQAALQTPRSPVYTQRIWFKLTSSLLVRLDPLSICDAMQTECQPSVSYEGWITAQIANHHTELYRWKYFKYQAQFVVTLNVCTCFRIGFDNFVRNLLCWPF
jgi:hypothetical protein